MPPLDEPTPSPDVAALSEAAAQGDRAAIDALLERYIPELRAFVRLRAGKVIRARESTSDVVQSVCRDVLENMDRFRHPSEGAFKNWLFTTAMRKLSGRRDFNLAQKRDMLREVPIRKGSSDGDAADDGVAESRLFAAYQSFTTPSRHAVVREEIERIEGAFDELTDEQREVVTLAHVVGASRKEIAEQLGKTEGAVRVILHRALAKVADLLAEDDTDAGR